MSADAETLAKALRHALELRELGATVIDAAEEASKQYSLGPLDEEWLLKHLTESKGAE